MREHVFISFRLVGDDSLLTWYLLQGTSFVRALSFPHRWTSREVSLRNVVCLQHPTGSSVADDECEEITQDESSFVLMGMVEGDASPLAPCWEN